MAAAAAARRRCGRSPEPRARRPRARIARSWPRPRRAPVRSRSAHPRRARPRVSRLPRVALSSTRCEASPLMNNEPPTASSPAPGHCADQRHRQEVLSGALGERQILDLQACRPRRRAAARSRASTRGLDVVRARSLDFLPGHDAVVVLVDEHRPHDVLQGQVPAQRRPAPSALRHVDQQVAGAGRMRERRTRRAAQQRAATARRAAERFTGGTLTARRGGENVFGDGIAETGATQPLGQVAARGRIARGAIAARASTRTSAQLPLHGEVGLGSRQRTAASPPCQRQQRRLRAGVVQSPRAASRSSQADACARQRSRSAPLGAGGARAPSARGRGARCASSARASARFAARQQRVGQRCANGIVTAARAPAPRW